MLRTLIAAAFLLGIQATALADVFRWVDANGQVQYSDRWVEGSVLVKTDRSKPDAAANAARQTATQNSLAASNQRIGEQQEQLKNERAMQQDVAKSREEQCKKATERYDKSVKALRIYREGKDGKKEFVPAAEADAYRAQTRADMQAVCGNAAK